MELILNHSAQYCKITVGQSKSTCYMTGRQFIQTIQSYERVIGLDIFIDFLFLCVFVFSVVFLSWSWSSAGSLRWSSSLWKRSAPVTSTWPTTASSASTTQWTGPVCSAPAPRELWSRATETPESVVSALTSTVKLKKMKLVLYLNRCISFL